MRKFNVKLFLILMAGVVVLGGGLYGVHYLQYQRIGRALLYQANRAEEQGQIERVAKYLKDYLEFAPQDTGARKRLGLAWTSEAFASKPRTRLRGVELLNQVLIKEPNQPEVHKAIVRVSLYPNTPNPKSARDHLQPLWNEVQMPDANLSTKERGEIESLWGQLYEMENKPIEAMVWYRQAVEHAPEEALNYVRLATLLRKQGQTEPALRDKNYREADALMDTLVATNPQSYQSYLARWGYRRDFGLLSTPGVPRDVQALVRRYVPGAAGELLTDPFTAASAILTAAGEDVEAALKRAPEELEVLIAAADMERLKGRYSRDTKASEQHRQEARAHLQLGLQLQSKPGYRGASEQAKYLLLWHLANLLLDARQIEEAAQLDEPAVDNTHDLLDAADAIAQLKQLHSIPVGTVDYLEGRLFRAQRRWAEAAVRLEQARPQLANRPELTYEIDCQLGVCYEKLEEPGLMMAAYERAIKHDPSSVKARLGIGAAQWAMDRGEQAIQNYQAAMEHGQVPAEGWLDIARLQVLVQLRRERGDRIWKEAEAALDRAEQATPQKVELKLLRAEVLAAQDQFSKAEEYLRDALAKTPEEVELWVARAGLAESQKDGDPSAVLDLAVKQAGDRVELRLARARLALRHVSSKDPKEPPRDPEKSKQAITTVLEKMEDGWQKFKPADQSKLLDGLAEVHYVNGNLGKARDLWGKMAQLSLNQDDLRLRLLLFDLAVRADDKNGIDRTLADIDAIEHGQGVYHRFGQAVRLIWLAKQESKPTRRNLLLTEARLLLDQAAKMRETWPRIALARAEIEQMRGNAEEAISYMKKAIEQGETSAVVIQQLVDALVQRQRYAEADQELARLRKSLLVDSELGKIAATAELKRGNRDKALELARFAVKSDTKDYHDLVWHARLLFVAKNDQEAFNKVRQAISIADREPEPYVAMVQFLAARGRIEEAMAVVKEARDKLPPARAPLALAQCYESLGLGEDARKSYDAAVKQNPGDVVVLRTTASFYLKTGHMNEVVPLLRAVVDGRVEASPENVAWARRGLAMVLAASRNYEQYKEALQLVGLKLDDNGQLVRENARDASLESSDTIRAKARVLASQSDQRQFRERAIEMLEGLGQRGSLLPDDKYVLALLYDAGDNWQMSRKQLRELSLPLTKGDAPQYLMQAPQYLPRYVIGLMRNGDYKEAERVLDVLDRIERDHGAQRGSFGTVELRAQLMEKSGEGDKALTLLRNYAAENRTKKNMALMVVSSLARQKRYEEALALLDKEADNCYPQSAAAVYVSLLNEMNPTDEQCLRVEKWLKGQLEVMEKQLPQTTDPNRVKDMRGTMTVLRHGLARLYDLRGRYPESEAVYRSILQEQQSDVLALNNLSWLLAQRSSDGKAALELIDRAITNMGRRADLLDTRGLAYLALGETDKALADFKEAATDDRTPTRLFHLARAHYAAKDRATALKAMQDAKSAGLDPSKLHPVEQLSCRQLMSELKVQ